MRQPSAPRAAVILMLSVAVCAAALPLATTSCHAVTQQGSDAELAARERLRALTHANADPSLLPPEAPVAALETAFPDTTVAALARLVRARLRLAARDFAGAASLLDTKVVRQRTDLEDYRLLLRARALEAAGRTIEARAAAEQLARQFPASLRAREATLQAGTLALQAGQAAAVPLLVKPLSDADDAAALLLTAKAYEQQADTLRAVAAYRRLYFYAPDATAENAEATAALARLNATTAPATAAEASARADKLFAAKRHGDAADAYRQAFAAFPTIATAPAQLRRGIAAFNANNAARNVEAVTALNAVPTSAAERAEALFYLAQAYARGRQWPQARDAADELRRTAPQSAFARRAPVAVGQIAKDAKNNVEALNFFRAAVAAYPREPEVAPAQFELAWAQHELKNYAESARLLLEHLSDYADRNTDFRGRAGYWAGRDLERAGRTAEARAIYQGMQQRYDANWYGYLARQRLDASGGSGSSNPVAVDARISRAVANLATVSVAEETATTTDADTTLTRVDQLNLVGFDDDALDEVNKILAFAPRSPRLNLAKARVYRARNQNTLALLTLQKSYPDYSQMRPAEMSRAAWDVFYPLNNWDTIKTQARARSIDPYTVAGLIRQETVFDPRAVSPAKAYGLMQLLFETAQRTARKYGVAAPVSTSALFDPQLNVQLGTAYLRDQLDRFGRIEYVAAAYNAGPNRVVTWRATLPADLDEWAEAVPFKETRGYIQGVVRNTMQYRRLYDDAGQFRPEVGTAPLPQAVKETNDNGGNSNSVVRPRRVVPDEDDEQDKEQ